MAKRMVGPMMRIARYPAQVISHSRMRCFSVNFRQAASTLGGTGVATALTRLLYRLSCMHPVLNSVDHRPWPLPSGPWIMEQTWNDLLFAHWPLPPEILRPLVPSVLPLDTFEGQCWLALTPFHMTGIRARWLPPLPRLSRVPEMNVLAYVTLDGKPGVFFFSLDAANLPAVWAARLLYNLPSFHA